MSDGSNKIKKKIFYVNSYGGSGSYLLCEYLAKYDIAYHLHERKVYDRLRKASGKNTVKIGQHLAHLDGKDISEDDERRAEEQVQKLTDSHVAIIDGLLKEKEEELMEI